MRHFLNLIIFAFLCNAAPAQSLKSEKGDLTKALSKSKKEGKPVCLLIIPPEKVTVPKGYLDIRKDSRITSVLNSDFVNYILAVDDTSYASIRKRYRVQRMPVLLLLDGEGELYYRQYPNFKNADSLLAGLSRARDKFKSGKHILWYNMEYKRGIRDTSFLKNYIAEREGLGIYLNHQLVQDYADQLTIKHINTVPVTAYLLHTGLIYGSPLYELVSSKKKVRDSAWVSFPLKERSEINRRIRLNTYGEAVKTKNAVLARKSAEYTRGLWSRKDYRLSRYLYEKQMVSYYRDVKDTTQLINMLRFYIDNNFAKVTVDTLQKYRKLYPQLTKDRVEDGSERPELYNKEVSALVARQAYAGMIARTPIELNSAAWNVYQYSKNKDMQFKAVVWSQTSIKLDPKAEYYDTLAHLLYVLEFYHEAEQTQLKGIKLASSVAAQAEKYRRALEKMKTKTL